MKLKDFDPATINNLLSSLSEEAHSIVLAGVPNDTFIERRTAFMRYVGQGHEITVSLPNRDLKFNDTVLLKDTFDNEYRRFNSRVIPGADIEVLSWVVTVSTSVEQPSILSRINDKRTAESSGVRQMYDASRNKMVGVPLYLRKELPPGAIVLGPSVIVENETTTYVPYEFNAHINVNGYIVLERQREKEEANA